MKTLRKYQREALYFLAQRGGGALFMEMGLGKTLVASRFAKIAEAKKILVVAPYAAFDGWVEEILGEGFQSYCLLDQPRKQRLQLLRVPCQWYLLNKEGFLVVPEIAAVAWDLVILDESTFIKSPSSKVSKFFNTYFQNVPHKIIMTGTPAPESELNYFQQLNFVDRSILPFKDYWQFRFKCFSQGLFEWKIKPQMKQWLNHAIASNCFCLTRSQAGIKDVKVYEKRVCLMPAALRAEYNELLKSFTFRDERTVWATTKFLWMRRLFSESKIHELVDLLETELKTQQVVIWTIFDADFKLIAERLSELKINYTVVDGKVCQKERSSRLNRFKLGEKRVLIAQPECFKYSIDLSNAPVFIYYSSPIGYEARSQSEARATRSKAGNVLIIDLVVKNSFDEEIFESIKQKENKQQMTKRILRYLNEKSK